MASSGNRGKGERWQYDAERVIREYFRNEIEGHHETASLSDTLGVTGEGQS